jgi:hypothetical protein
MSNEVTCPVELTRYRIWGTGEAGGGEEKE